MGELKNRPVKNLYGDGYEQEYIDDNGDRYIIRNSPVKNLYGDGYKKVIEKRGSSTTEVTEEDIKHIDRVVPFLIAGFMAFIGFATSGSNIISWVCLIVSIVSGLNMIIHKPSVVVDFIILIIKIAIIVAIAFIPFIPGFLECMH